MKLRSSQQLASQSDDKQSGTWTYYYKASTQVLSTGNYSNGKREGSWEFFYKDGNKWKFGAYANDLKEGQWKIWHENGTTYYIGVMTQC